MRYVYLLLVTAAGLFAQPAAKPEDLASIEGHVLNLATGEFVGKASLTLRHLDASRTYGTISDASGRFRIQDVEPGLYRLEAVRHGFVNGQYGSRSLTKPGSILNARSRPRVEGRLFSIDPARRSDRAHRGRRRRPSA